MAGLEGALYRAPGSTMKSKDRQEVASITTYPQLDPS